MVDAIKTGKKDNSQRRYPGQGGRRHNPVNTDLKRKEAKERQEVWSKLGPKGQLAALDARLGKGVGAVRQRARLQGIIDNPRPKKGKEDEGLKKGEIVMVAGETGPREKAKDRRAAERAKRPAH